MSLQFKQSRHYDFLPYSILKFCHKKSDGIQFEVLLSKLKI